MIGLTLRVKPLIIKTRPGLMSMFRYVA